ncbi:MAG: APC family permease [Mycobacteriales bacterium]|nr:MAG: hypothetical protein DLM56_01075 [Pseudonocardiales bacterium]
MAVDSDTAPDTALRSGSVRFAGTVGSAVGIQAPAGGVSFLPALMAGVVGVAGPFAFGSAVIVMLFVAYAFVVFTREFASAGSVWAFCGRAVSPSYGLLCAWLLIFVYVAYAGSVFASNANGLVTLVAPGLIGGHGWLAFAAGLWLVTVVLTRYSIRVSTSLVFLLEFISLVLVAVVAVAVLAHGGAGGDTVSRLSYHPFSPGAIPIGTLGLGLVFAFTGFSGFEVAATLGEESRAPRRVIPWAMVVALLVSGGIYTLISYVETVAYPSPQALAAAAEHGVPLASTASTFVGSGFGTVINVAAVISGFGAQLATVNGATRLLFALARSHLAPAPLGVTHPVHHTPTRALAVVAVATIVPVLALYFRPPLEAFADLATYGADVIAVAYLLTVLAAIVFTARRRPLRPTRLLLLVAGAVLMGYVIKTTVYPLPVDTALRLYLYAAAATLLAGIAVVVIVRLVAADRLSAAPPLGTDPAG